MCQSPTQGRPLPGFVRFYIYGIQGFCDEIVFTALLNFISTGNTTFKGHSSLSSFFIYGLYSLIIEHVYVFLYHKHRTKWYFRFLLYLVLIYTWEFISGWILRQFDACPWDYSDYSYNFMGLVTLEYAPAWLFANWLLEQLSEYLLTLRSMPKIHEMQD